ncbi:MAG TPA: hydrogenase maturation protease [Anaerolineales bacterium]|nr:hydrogenase maturation protease [Anaerolineales bacterium]
MKTIVIGLGNPILGDDGVGWKVAEEVKKQLTSPLRPSPIGRGDGGEGYIDVEFLSLGGLSLMEHLIGYERAILIDAIAVEQEPGSVFVSKLSELPDYSAFHTTSVHDTSLQNALKLGKAMGASLPEDVTVVGITTSRIYDFSEQLSPVVAEAATKAAKIVITLLA